MPQPPEIRHRVLRSSDGLEVIEIGVPSDHATVLDHEMELPNNGGMPGDPGRTWKGQKFVRYRKREEDQETRRTDQETGGGWRPHRVPGFEARDTGIAEGTKVRLGKYYRATR